MNTKMSIYGLLLMIVLMSSCAQKKTPVRSVKQTQSQMMNTTTSQPSIRAADAQSLLYDITVLERPTFDFNNTPQVVSEIRTPDGRYISITTSHQGSQDSYGIVEDSKNGVRLDVRARCVGENCEKYLLLVTVVKSGYAYHQLAAISYNQDCYFNLENINYSVNTARFYASLDELNQRNNVQSKNDCPLE